MVLFAGTGEAFTSKKTAYASQAEALFMTVSKIRFSDSLFVIDCFYLFYVKSSNITNNQWVSNSALLRIQTKIEKNAFL